MLTDAKCRNARPKDRPYKLTDSHGLYLEVRPRGSKLWRYRYRIDGKENVFALGEYPEMGLERARKERIGARALIKQGIHPSHRRKAQVAEQVAANANTFDAVAKTWIASHGSQWTPYYRRQIERFMVADVYKYIGSLPIKSITSAHLLDIILRVEKRGAETVAILIRQTCSAIFRYAVSKLLADGDPAAALKGAIKRPKVQNRVPIKPSSFPSLSKAMDTYGGYRTTVIALRLLAFTFVRTVELRKAEWAEFDMEGATWRIPAPRMKMREEHTVPLSHQAITLLRELNNLTGNQRFLFPNYRRPSEPMTATTLNRALERMGYGGKVSGHTFRATASTVLNEAGFRGEVIERQLAHRERNKVRGSYNQASYLKERTDMMQQWADMLDAFMAGDKRVVASSFGKAA